MSVSNKISNSSVRRISIYLRILERMEKNGDETVSSEELSDYSGTTAAQVRKDLSSFGSFGKRGLGYGVPELALCIRKIIGVD